MVWQEIRQKKFQIEKHCTSALAGTSEQVYVFDVDQAAIKSNKQLPDHQ